MSRVAFPALVLALVMALAAAPASAQSVPQSREQITLSFAPVVKAVAPAVVNVYATRVVRERALSPFFDDPFFRRFFGDVAPGLPRERMQNSLGSGVIVSAEGLVVTNNHVIAGADEVKVVLSDRREFAAEIVLRDERTDLAVLRIQDRGRLPAVAFQDSDALEVGDLVLAIGNPFGVGQTVTAGIVSGLARTRTGISDFGFFIQTDAAINPGNSGGALVDMNGRLVGVNTAIFSRSGGSIGIGFAIPSNMVRLVVGSVATGTVRRPWFGAQLQPVTPEIAASLGMDRPVGVIVGAARRGSPAARAGLRTGDVVVAVDDQEVNDENGFRYRFSTRGLDGVASLTIRRNGRRLVVPIALEPAPEDPPRDEVLLDSGSPFNGATIANLSPAVADELGIFTEIAGVAVTAVDPRSAAARVLGLRPGDVIVEVNGRPIDTTGGLTRVVEQPQRLWRITIERGGRRLSSVIGG